MEGAEAVPITPTQSTQKLNLISKLEEKINQLKVIAEGDEEYSNDFESIAKEYNVYKEKHENKLGAYKVEGDGLLARMDALERKIIGGDEENQKFGPLNLADESQEEEKESTETQEAFNVSNHEPTANFNSNPNATAGNGVHPKKKEKPSINIERPLGEKVNRLEKAYSNVSDVDYSPSLARLAVDAKPHPLVSGNLTLVFIFLFASIVMIPITLVFIAIVAVQNLSAAAAPVISLLLSVVVIIVEATQPADPNNNAIVIALTTTVSVILAFSQIKSEVKSSALDPSTIAYSILDKIDGRIGSEYVIGNFFYGGQGIEVIRINHEILFHTDMARTNMRRILAESESKNMQIRPINIRVLIHLSGYLEKVNATLKGSLSSKLPYDIVQILKEHASLIQAAQSLEILSMKLSTASTEEINKSNYQRGFLGVLETIY